MRTDYPISWSCCHFEHLAEVVEAKVRAVEAALFPQRLQRREQLRELRELGLLAERCEQALQVLRRHLKTHA